MSARAKNNLKLRLEDLFKAACYDSWRSVMLDAVNHLDENHPDAITAFTKWMHCFERILVKNPGDRFNMDCWMLSNAVSTLENKVALSKYIVPFYMGEWLYFSPPQPTFKNENAHRRIYGISFPGSDFVEDFHPLDYSWLYHELGHHIIDRLNSNVFAPVTTAMKHLAQGEKRRFPSASAPVRKIISERLKRFQQAWSPESLENWTTEIISDVISLWCCGPAFLRSIHEIVHKFTGNPFLMDNTHLPHALRIRLMLEAGDSLGWSKYLDALHQCNKQWKTNNGDTASRNEFAAMVQGGLPSLVLKTSLDICRNNQLPRCTSSSVESAREWANSPKSITSTPEFILGAWVKYVESRKTFDEWESKVIDLFNNELKA